MCAPRVSVWAWAKGSSSPARRASVTTSAVAAAKIATAVRTVWPGRARRSARASRRNAVRTSHLQLHQAGDRLRVALLEAGLVGDGAVAHGEHAVGAGGDPGV